MTGQAIWFKIISSSLLQSRRSGAAEGSSASDGRPPWHVCRVSVVVAGRGSGIHPAHYGPPAVERLAHGPSATDPARPTLRPGSSRYRVTSAPSSVAALIYELANARPPWDRQEQQAIQVGVDVRARPISPVARSIHDDRGPKRARIMDDGRDISGIDHRGETSRPRVASPHGPRHVLDCSSLRMHAPATHAQLMHMHTKDNNL